MFIWANDFHAIFWWRSFPPCSPFSCSDSAYRSQIRHRAQTQQSAEARKPEKLSAAYWWVVAIGSIFTLARFSEAFLVLRAQQMEIPLYTIPLVMVAMNGLQPHGYPFGKLSDSMSHSKLLQWGCWC